MNIRRDQNMLLNISERGKLSSKLHASILYPEVFGGFTENEREENFGGPWFKTWTSVTTVLREAHSMSKKIGMANILSGDDAQTTSASVQYAASSGNPFRRSTKEGFVKIVAECR